MERMATDTQARVRAALAQLPVEQRQVIELTLFAGLTQRAIAAQLNCAEAEVPQLARRALRAVQDFIDNATERQGTA